MFSADEPVINFIIIIIVIIIIIHLAFSSLPRPRTGVAASKGVLPTFPSPRLLACLGPGLAPAQPDLYSLLARTFVSYAVFFPA